MKVMVLLSGWLLVLLSGCVTPPGNVRNTDTHVGPDYSGNLTAPQSAQENHTIDAVKASDIPRIDVIIPVFNPGLSEDYDSEEVWPELRRAEANLFAYKLKNSMELTEQFGAVRVMPDHTSTGELYVSGKIVESNGEEIEIDIEATDASGREWLSRSYHHRVPENFFFNPKYENQDPYGPIFKNIANDIAEKLADFDQKELTDLQALAQIRFGASFSAAAFSPYLKTSEASGFAFWKRKGRFALAALPSDADPMMLRIKSLRVRDQLFVDSMQSHYEAFNQRIAKSYSLWQEGSHGENVAIRRAKQEAIKQSILGVLLIAGAAYTANINQSNNPALTTTAVATGLGGVFMLSESIKTAEEASFHRDALEELGQSLNITLEPQIVAFNDRTEKLTGDANEQFHKWREFLKKIFEAETAIEGIKL